MNCLQKHRIGKTLTPLTFLVAPLKTFEALKSKPQWIAPYLFTVLGLIVKTVLSNTWGSQSFIFQAHALYLYGIVITILVVMLWSAISIFLYLSIFIMSEEIPLMYKGIFSIVSYCGEIFLIGEVINYLLIRVNIIDSMMYALPKQFPMGLDILTLEKSLSPVWVILLHSINPFSIWYFAMLSVGLSVVTGLSRTKSSLLSFILWLLAVGFTISVLLITGETSLRFKF